MTRIDDLFSAANCVLREGYEGGDLPRDWSDSRWPSIQDKCGLSLPEMTALQSELLYQYEVARGTATGRGDSTAAVEFLKTQRLKAEDVPTDFFDRKWRNLQKKCGINDIDLAWLRYTLAVAASDEQEEPATTAAAEFASLDFDFRVPMETGVTSNPFTSLRRRRKEKTKSGV